LALAASWHVGLAVSGSPLVPDYGRRIVAGIDGEFSFSTMMRGAMRAERFTLALWIAALAWLVVCARRDRAARLLLAMFGCGVTILAATGTAMQHYTLPLYLPLAIGVGWSAGRLLGARPIYAPLGACALVTAFAAGNLSLFVHPDLSPGADAIAAQTRALAPRQPVWFFRDYSASFDYYLDADTVLVTESQRAYDLYTAHGAMREGPGIELVAPAELLRRLSTPGMACVTTLFSADALREYLAALPPAVADSLQFSEVGAYLLVHLPAEL
jgi:hypothetical protein